MFSTVILLAFISTLVSLQSHAAPLLSRALEARATCGDGGESPCICGGALGIRKKALQCPNESFKFQNPTPTTGKVALTTGNLGSVQCDHIVELQFIANEIEKVPAICTKFKASNADFQTFFNNINASPNLVFVEGTVNNAKGQVFGGNTLRETTQQAGDGLISYLRLLKSGGKAAAAAAAVDTAMTGVMGAGNGFPAGFATRFNSAIDSAVTKVTGLLKTLPPAPTPGDPFIDCTDSTIAKATKTRRSIWTILARAVTGKKPVPAKSCPVPPKSTAKPAANPSIVAKPAAKPVAKPAAKPAAKPPAKPVAKPAPKPVAKPAAKPAALPAAKPVAKPAVAKPVAKPAAKPVAKPATKPVVKPAVKPVTKPAANPVVKPAAKPAVKPAPKPVAKPAAKPVARPAVKPVAKPIVKPKVTLPKAKGKGKF